MSIQTPSDYSIYFNKCYDYANPVHRAKIATYVTELLRPVLPVEKQSPILEIGCGSGMALLALHNMGYNSLKGIDCSPELINIARSFSLDVESADALEYLDGIESNHFSLIYMIGTFEHIPAEKTLGLFCRIFGALSPGGRLFLQVPNADSPVGLRCRNIDWPHHYGFTAHSISHLLENAGFREMIINESLPREPKPEDFEGDEEGRKSYGDSHRKFLGTTLARRITRWQIERLLPEARQIPLTPNINVLATKKAAGEPVSCNVIVDSDDGDFDPLKFIDQIAESTWKIRSLQEWISLIETRFTSYKQQQDSLREDLIRERDRLDERNRLLESEFVRLKKRNIFGVFFIDLLKTCFSVIRYPFVMANAIRRLPSTYEEVVDRQYYGVKNERTRRRPPEMD
ncbi:MAG: class I SAM-dependent methyltransferase [Rectinemataceae bacterium]|nr:class I SAM-dependent methyltransferase [Rectinemataceae bacterium]